LLGDAPGAEQPAYEDSDWRRLDVPHDWSIEDLPPATPQTYKECLLPVVTATWRFHKGDDAGWKAPNLDDSSWQSLRMPDTWEHHSNYTEDNVYGWYRRRVEIPAQYKGKDVTFLLGRIDDVDEAFVNGVRIGGSGTFPPEYKTAWFEDRRYVVPASLLKFDGTDLLAVRVFDGPNIGGLVNAPDVPLARIRVGPFDTHLSEGGMEAGYFVGGVGWYRKAFKLPARDRGKSVRVRFDGVYMNSDVWINGHHLGNHPYGYTAFDYDLTTHLNPPGHENVLAVRVRNVGKNTRWYSGSGIYRHVWLTVTDPMHVATYGVFVTTAEATDKQAAVHVSTTLQNNRSGPTVVRVRTTILGPTDAPSAVGDSNVITVNPAASEVVEQTLVVKKPRRWSVDSPTLYIAVVEIIENGRVIDRASVPFGIRTLSFDSRLGFQLNGQTLKLHGACLHHDNGPLGAVAIDRAEERRVEIMKANGFNAIRTAHNPPSSAFLDACDRLGMLVMDESFDQWRMQKTPQDYHRFFDEWWQRDTDSMVLRDRNHPCVIVWSIGNEISERFTEEGVELARLQADRVRQLDPTRPVTAALCGTVGKDGVWRFGEQTDALCGVLDIAGYNYGAACHVDEHRRRPERVIMATESFFWEAFDYWMSVWDNPHVVGDFVWTGIDYFGESGVGFNDSEGIPVGPGQGRWPAHGASCGDLDVCGFKKPQSYYRDVVWNRSPLEMFVRNPLGNSRKITGSWSDGLRATPPAEGEESSDSGTWALRERSWTWPGQENTPLRVWVCSTAQQVRLNLNGELIGTKKVSRQTRLTATFEVPYRPGVLTAEAIADGKIVARQSLRTAGAPAKLRLTADRPRIRPDRNDLTFVTVEVLDRAGVVVPDTALTANFRITGPGELATVGNGDLRFVGSFRQPHCLTHQGRCLAVIRPKGKAGTIRLRASSSGLAPASLTIVTQTS
jgi:beta-galactosidase